ncbi:MAG: phosphopantetheine-binding protein, partial [Aggregatilineales bacterium]
LGAMRDQFPELPQLKPEELAELRTLGEIVDYMHNNAGGSSPTPPTSPAPTSAPAPVAKPAPVAQSAPVATPVETPAPASSGGVSLEALETAMLEIVSDKTGYPVEMLEVDMDIEADLGIDSIKRVEILGAMRDQFPELPQLKPEELAELRTLGEIVEYMNTHQPAANGATAGASNGHTNGTNATNGTNGGTAKVLPTMTHDIPRHAAHLKYLPKPDWIEASLPEGYIALVTDDGTALTTEVTQNLTSRGWKVVVLSFPQDVVPAQSALANGVNRVVLPDTTEAQLQSTLESISAQYGAIGAFIHLNPQAKTLTGSAPNGNVFIEQEKTILKHIFLLAKHLKKSLNASADAGFGAFMTVARLDGAFSTTERNGSGAISGGLFGLTKSVNLEWVNVFCRALDLTSALSDSMAAEKVTAELFDPNRLLVEVGYTNDGRVTLVAEDFALS